MSTIFIGNYKRIKKDAKSIDYDGHWRELKYGGRLGRQYRTRTGAVLNWCEKSGKITFQGHGEAARKFEDHFKAKASAKGRLRHDADVTGTCGTDKGAGGTKVFGKRKGHFERDFGNYSLEVAMHRGRH